MPKKCLKAIVVLLLLCTFTISRAQTGYEVITKRIDSLANLGLPKSALAEVARLDALARKNNNSPQVIRAAIYHITFQSYLEENALVAIIGTLKDDIKRSAFPVKPVLQSLLADMYWRYYQQQRWQINQRTRLDKPDADFTRWDLRTLISQINSLYQASLQNTDQLQATPVSVLNGVLTGNAASRYLRPTLYDLLVHRAFEFYLGEEPNLTKPRNSFNLNDARLFGSNSTFASVAINTTDTASILYRGLKYLQQVTAFHLKKGNTEALADIDLIRLKLIYAKSNLAQKDALYLGALQTLAQNFAEKPISADAWTIIGHYYKAKDSLVAAHKAYSKAFGKFPESVGGINAKMALTDLEYPSLSAAVEGENLPGKPMLALLQYRNLNTASVQVYHLTQPQFEKYQQLQEAAQQERWRSDLLPREKVSALMAYLRTIKAVQSQTLTLPALNDYKNHTAEFKLDALPGGSYVLLVNRLPATDTSLTQLTNFAVSNLAYTVRANPNGDKEFMVMHRYTGKPLKDVKVLLTSKDYNYNSVTKKSEYTYHKKDDVTDANGKFIQDIQRNNGNGTLRLTLNNDTLTSNLNMPYGQRSNDDNEPKAKTILFTDRQIYRPGQTIYFKGLQIEMLHGKSKIFANKYVELELFDRNHKSLKIQQFTTNDFGTFNGSFIIPQNILNGNITLHTDEGEIRVKVEEYKRPTFKVEFAQVKESYRFGDTVKIKGKVVAFSGYGLSQARVAYHVTRTYNQVLFPKLSAGYNNRYRYEPPVEITVDTLLTDNQGNYTIKFKALPGDERAGAETRHRYEVTANVTDASGETHLGIAAFNIGTRDIYLQANVPALQLAKDSVKIGISLNTLNNQPLKGSANVEIYALQSPGRVFNARLWPNAENSLITPAQYETLFTDYATRNQDKYEYWLRAAKITSLNTTTTGDDLKMQVDADILRKQPSGVYQVVIKAVAANGDTASVTRYINFVNKPASPASMAYWVMPIRTSIAAGQEAELLVGIGASAYILAEHFAGEKVVSSTWMNLDKQRSFKIPVTINDDNTAVQYLMVYHNRLYSSYQSINVQHPERKLDIKLTSFRNNLQPGQKEQWKLQVSGYKDEKQAAEMVASMYDASLDDITQPQSWQYGLNLNSRQYRYYAWNNYDFISQRSTQPLIYRYYNYTPIVRSYEQLNLFGYNYFGGYNNAYHQHLRNLQSAINLNRLSDEKLEEDYKRNAALVKTGYEISGTVTDQFRSIVPGVNIKIKGTAISTTTNSSGKFKIRVPVNSTLVFSFIGYLAQEITTTKAQSVSVKLLPDGKALNEVVVVGYGVQKRMETLGAVSVNQAIQGRVAGVVVNEVFTSINEPVGNAALSPTVQIRGLGSVTDKNAPLYIIDGYGDQGTLAGINPADIVSIEVLKDASATAIYGARAANGVVIVTTKNKGATGKQPLVIRKNFNETAFFYPQLRTDENGQILIDFTMPESLTRWRFRAFAHTQQLAGGYIQQDVVTQKQLMIGANMPRFLREGDTVTVLARIANLTAQTLKGRVELKLFNALNMQPVALLANPAEANQPFEVQGNANNAVSFKIIVPAGLDALTYRLTAQTDTYSDGEENTLPVLPNRMLVTESMPMMVRAGQTRQFTFNKLVNQKSTTLVNKTLTLEYTQNPAWYAVQAMPYLMEFAYECSEQTFSRYFANSLSAGIVNRNPQIKTVFDLWKATDSKELLSNLEKNPELKATLLEETPWLQDAINKTEQKKRIALLFDLNKLSYEQEQSLDKLLHKQLPNGAFPWFGGNFADRYITQHIFAGIGQLYHLKIASTANDKLTTISKNAMAYIDAELINDDKESAYLKKQKTHSIDALEIHAWYARSYYANAPMSAGLKAVQQLYLVRAAKQWLMLNIYQQALVALTLQRYGKPDVAKAIIRSLKETAQQSNDEGMYWAKNQLGWYWYQSPVETQSVMIELFTEAGNEPKAVEEMKIWLLRNKQTNNWRTTKATALACYALLLKGDDLLNGNNASTIKLDGQPLTQLKPDVKTEAGTGYLKTTWANEQVKPALGNAEVANSGKSISWGALHWQYTEQMDKLTPSTTDIKLERKYFIEKQDAAGAVLTAVDAQHQPKTGDLLKVVVYLKAGRNFEYIHLKDMRPAGTEPVDVLSAFNYQDGLYYYQVTKDVATNFFISKLNKGNYVFEYKLRVAQAGNFSTGISTVQSMYAPEFNAHSEGRRLEIFK